MQKPEARREIGRRVSALAPAERAEKSLLIRDAVLRLPEYAAAHIVMLFVAMPDEVDTFPIIESALDARRTVLLPKVLPEGGQMIACPVEACSDLIRGAYGILEPRGFQGFTLALIEFCLVPARAFDRSGRRLGRGAGYYDRFMARPGFRAFRCGIAFHAQLLDVVPAAEHDLPVHAIVTELEVIRPGDGG